MIEKVVKRLVVFAGGKTLWLPVGVVCERCTDAFCYTDCWVIRAGSADHKFRLHFPPDRSSRERIGCFAVILGRYASGDMEQEECEKALQAMLNAEDAA